MVQNGIMTGKLIMNNDNSALMLFLIVFIATLFSVASFVTIFNIENRDRERLSDFR